jgi:hypothetical protein
LVHPRLNITTELDALRCSGYAGLPGRRWSGRSPTYGPGRSPAPGRLINRSTDDVQALTAEAETDDKIGDQDRHSKGDPNRRDHMPKTQLHAPGNDRGA